MKTTLTSNSNLHKNLSLKMVTMILCLSQSEDECDEESEKEDGEEVEEEDDEEEEGEGDEEEQDVHLGRSSPKQLKPVCTTQLCAEPEST